MRRELAAARWDRRLGRVAAALVVAGVGLNAVVGLRDSHVARPAEAGLARREGMQSSLVATAAAVAEATDAETGRSVARQMAALGGWELSDEQAAAIDDAARTRQGSGFGVQGSADDEPGA